MPTTIVALIIIIFAVLPGFPAYKIYKLLNGTDWRLSDWEKIINIILFSLLGLMLYIVFSTLLNLTMPIYVLPETFTTGNFDVSVLPRIAFALLGHFFFSVLSSLLTYLIIRITSKHTRFSGSPSAWDYFISNNVPDHWVIIRIKNGESFAGIIDYTDTSVGQNERDIILREPARFDKDQNNYLSLTYHSMFISAAMIDSIGVVEDSSGTSRVSTMNNYLFPNEDKNE